MRKIFFAVLLVPALAWAAPSTAAEWFKQGEKDYTLGNFDKAVEAFKKAFELETDESKRAAYVFNIAQAYRQSNDCVKAQFFYKRFISLKSNDTVKPLSPEGRKVAEDFIRDLEPCVQQAKALGQRPPDGLDTSGQSERPTEASPARRDPQVATAAPVEDRGTEEDPEIPPPDTGPHVISARVAVGGTKITAGDIPVPVQVTFAATLGYPIAINDKLTVEAGGVFTFTPVPYQTAMTNEMPAQSKTAQMISGLANAGLAYEVYPRLYLRGDIGLGALVFREVTASRFTEGRPTSGGLAMLHVRAAASLDYAVTPNVVVTVPLAFSYSPPKEGLADSINAITSFDFMAGIGYRM